MSVKHEIRALSSALSNVPNVKYLAHLAYQTQKWTFIRCAKCAKIIEHAIVRSHFWKRTDPNAISVYWFLFIFLSPLSSLYSFFFSLLSHSSSDIPHLFFHSFFFSLLWLFSLLFSLTDLCCYGFFFFFLQWFDGWVR